MLEALDEPERFRQRYDADIGSYAETARGTIQQTFEFQARVGATAPWVGYLTADAATGQIVGTCGFKGNPTPEGTVEIAYGTVPGFEGRGWATAVAQKMVEIAAQSGVRCVLAHTLPERNASCRVLEKTGFEFVGEVEDPEDGTVWQWRRE